MSKKEKKIEVHVSDVDRRGQNVQQVSIGNRLIGEIVADGQRFKATLTATDDDFYVRSQEEGLETILQQYHLHQH